MTAFGLSVTLVANPGGQWAANILGISNDNAWPLAWNPDHTASLCSYWFDTMVYVIAMNELLIQKESTIKTTSASSSVWLPNDPAWLDLDAREKRRLDLELLLWAEHCHVNHSMSPVFGRNMVATDDSEKLSAEYQWNIIHSISQWCQHLSTVHHGDHHGTSPHIPTITLLPRSQWLLPLSVKANAAGVEGLVPLPQAQVQQLDKYLLHLYFPFFFHVLFRSQEISNLQTNTSCSWLLKAKALIGRELGPLDEAFEDLRLPLEEDRLGGPGPSWEKSAFQTPGHHRSGYKINWNHINSQVLRGLCWHICGSSGAKHPWTSLTIVL